ncbi:hypothetical protein UZ73_08465 [Alcaligenes faecalis]|uniref:hypothetical protein n=1 Tax=Alcaligenes faecalis TaxID=511 RepID=UPI0005F987C6|nr:hypothetical protein [Alcaligenes faecalis]ALO38292.1 hypothetical protein UZ73_08465 [Alcaligenes faecalis]
MSLYNKKWSISMPVAIVVIAVLLLVAFGTISILMTNKGFLESEGPLWVFASGVVSGLVVTLAQFCLSWADAKAIDRFRRMGVENVLTTRDEEEYYGQLIRKARSQVDVLGATATRLMEDFADSNSPKAEKRALIKALTNNVRVRILVASPERLDARDQYKCTSTRQRFEAMAAAHSNFEVRYFDATPIAAFVRADTELVVGPLLPGVESKHTPALHVYNHSPYAESYLNYFEKTWATAKPLSQLPPSRSTP